MPRRKLPSNTNPNMAWEVCQRYKLNPIEELVKEYLFRVRIPDGADSEVVAKELKKYDVEWDDNGNPVALRRKADQRLAILNSLAEYVAPKLRSSETKEEKDYNITISIKTFDGKDQPKVIDLATSLPRSIGPSKEDSN
jgi:hypothetical protein